MGTKGTSEFDAFKHPAGPAPCLLQSHAFRQRQDAHAGCRIQAQNRDPGSRLDAKAGPQAAAGTAMAYTVTAASARRQDGAFDLPGEVSASLAAAGLGPADGDVVVVSSKYVSYSQGRLVDMGVVAVSEEARALASKYTMSPALAELVLRESDRVIGGMPGFVMAETPGGLIAPNAGIDRSNGGGTAVLYPEDPHAQAEMLRRSILVRSGARVGIVISDSRLLPARAGTSGTAVACAGFDPVDDMRGRPDLDGAPLKVTVRAVADSLAAAANLAMGEGGESTPLAVARGSGASLSGRAVAPAETAIPHDRCAYTRSLAGAAPPRGWQEGVPPASV